MNENKKEKTSVWINIITGLGLLAANLIAGVAFGLLWVKLFVPPKAMGWDGLADVLGGIMLGAVLGIIVGGALILFLSLRAQWIWTGGAILIGGLIFAGLVMTAPEREVSSEPISRERFRPSFVLRIRLTQTQEILATVPPSERPIPFVEAEVWTGKPELNRTDWDPNAERCVAAPSNADLATLLPLLQNAIAAAGPNCQTPEDDLNLSVRWNVENVPGQMNLDVGCLPDQPEFTALIDAVGTLADQLCVAEAGSDSTE